MVAEKEGSGRRQRVRRRLLRLCREVIGETVWRSALPESPKVAQMAPLFHRAVMLQLSALRGCATVRDYYSFLYYGASHFDRPSVLRS
jgi:hypothetical protein